MNNKFLKEPWLKWAIEIQSIAQSGLTYTKDEYDKERYEQLRNIASEMLSYKTDIPGDKVKDLFCNESGYQTPKLDTRAVVFEEDKILLVREKNGLWSLPGGWVDVLESIESNTIKEVKEESGLDVIAKRIIAIQDRNKHNKPLYPYGVCKIFVECEVIGGEFAKNIETTEIGYFSIDNLPTLCEAKSTVKQIEMCFKSKDNENWKVIFD